jgi:hypothetical protein
VAANNQDKEEEVRFDMEVEGLLTIAHVSRIARAQRRQKDVGPSGLGGRSVPGSSPVSVNDDEIINHGIDLSRWIQIYMLMIQHVLE